MKVSITLSKHPCISPEAEKKIDSLISGVTTSLSNRITEIIEAEAIEAGHSDPFGDIGKAMGRVVSMPMPEPKETPKDEVETPFDGIKDALNKVANQNPVRKAEPEVQPPGKLSILELTERLVALSSTTFGATNLIPFEIKEALAKAFQAWLRKEYGLGVNAKSVPA